MMEWLTDDKVEVSKWNIIDEGHVEIVYSSKEDAIEADLFK